jgi:5-oxoprolinase (ATP-hydrolysing)
MRTYQIAVDTGGTFTDCLATDSDGTTHRRKVLSNGTLRGTVVELLAPTLLRLSTNWGLSRDVLRGYTFRFLGETETAVVQRFDPDERLLILHSPFSILPSHRGFELTASEEAPVLAARLVTETALDELFPPLRMRLGSTKGTNALLEHKGAKVAFFVTEGFADLLRIGDQSRPDLFSLSAQRPAPLHAEVVEVPEQINAGGEVMKPIDFSALRAPIASPRADSVAVCLKNAYQNPFHEQQLAGALRERFRFVSVSTELSPHINFLARAETTVANAYLAPIIHEYLAQIRASLAGGTLHVMTSAGALVRADGFQPKDSLLSGPAGGVVGAATVAEQAGFSRLITFDMGGTSTDVARYDGRFDYRFETRIGNARLQAPTLSIETVAAGGGSVCGFDGFRLFVGPESAGSAPGPACYGAGGPLTLTDVNLLLGRLDPSTFGIPVFPEKSREQLDELLDRMAAESGQRPAAQTVLEGLVQIANETMAEAVRKISVAKGYDPADYALVAFGGAGGLHACGVARLLGIRTILLPADAGLLSAVGIGEAALERFAEATVLRELSEETWPKLARRLAELNAEALRRAAEEVLDPQRVVLKNQLAFLRLKGQETSLELDVTGLRGAADWRRVFQEKYVQTYGHWVEGRAVEVESLRVRAGEKAEPRPSAENPFPADFTARQGPTLLTDPFSTAFIEAGFALTAVTPDGTRILQKTGEAVSQKTTFDAHAELELFTNRFRAVAEQMGAMLQRTALSVNVKERLDFSCALLDADGRLVANAPHIPVHLGSLGVCVRRVRAAIALAPGDVVVTNHPGFGGSHLPDVTLITPVYGQRATGMGHGEAEFNPLPSAPCPPLIGYVVNRCHHAEIGGIRPASMPPNARNLAEEGVVIFPMKLVERGEVRWEAIRAVLTGGPYPTRNVDENLADLAAALAANRRGEAALRQLVKEHGLAKVHQQMAALLDHSARRMRQRLAQLPEGERRAEEWLDDGTRLCATIRTAQFSVLNAQCSIDFTGTAGVHPGNLNGTEAIVRSVVVYVLRVLLGQAARTENVPLNEGLLEPVEVVLPENSLLKPSFPENPAECPAVVGGNVELSQRLTDTLLKAFGLVACAQGTMNNVLFGNASFGYYETLAGGGGAGEGFAGISASQQHMTNTRITDPEILERRYPVRLRRFAIRRGSGGKGRWAGGDGLVRELEFLQPVELSVLTQHRVEAPYGLHGGQPGQRGRQWLVRVGGQTETLGGTAGASLQPGDRLIVETPGGGGYGSADENG